MKKLFRIIREGFVGLKRHSAMSFSSASAIMMTLIIIGVFFVAYLNVNLMVDNIETSVQIHVKIENDVDEDGIHDLMRKIKEIDGVFEVVYSTKDNELEKFIESYGDKGYLFEMYVGESNPMYNAFLVETVSGTEIQQIAEEISKIDGINSINYGGEGTITLIKALDSLKKWSYIIVLALSGLAVFLITNTIGTAIESRKSEIFIMRTVGASNSFIRAPFIVEGMFIGFLGAIIPVIVLSVGYIFIYRTLNGHLFSELLALAKPESFLLELVVILLGLGILIGALGSLWSVSRKLRWKR